MEFYGTLEQLLDYSPDSDPEARVPAVAERHRESTSLEQLLLDKTRTFVEILRQIDEDTETRKALFVKVVLDIYKQYSYLKTKLFELYYWRLGQSRSIEGRRSALEQQLDALNQERRREQIQCWKDVTGLRAELRTWFKQYRDLLQRVRMISKDW